MTHLPIGVCIGSIDADPVWWLDAARRLDAAGYDGIWCWDHFMGRGDPATPVVEAWTALTATAATTRRVRVGTFVANIMNCHPAVLARMASTLQLLSGGRLLLGLGIGGHPAEHAAYGIDFPPVAERVARVEEAVGVLRALWSGGPVTLTGRFYPLHDASAYPKPGPPPPIVIGGETRAGARLAGRLGDGWTAFDTTFEAHLPAYLEALEATGRPRAAQRVIVGFQGGWSGEEPIDLRPWTEQPAASWQRWQAAGADAVVVTVRREAEVAALVEAAARW